MKSTTQQILANCEKGIFTVVRDKKDNYFKVITPIKDKCGNFRDSNWYVAIEEAKQYAGEYGGDIPEELDEFDLEIVEEYRIIGEPFRVGDKVKILDSIKETSDWENYKDDFPEMKGKIRKVYNNICGNQIIETSLQEAYQKGFIDGANATGVQSEEIMAIKIREAEQKERQRIWDIIVDEFEELHLYFHEGFGGDRISMCQDKIAKRIKALFKPTK